MRCGTGLAQIRSALAQIVPVTVTVTVLLLATCILAPRTRAQRRRMVKLLNN